jgi:hypothetical protein
MSFDDIENSVRISLRRIVAIKRLETFGHKLYKYQGFVNDLLVAISSTGITHPLVKLAIADPTPSEDNGNMASPFDSLSSLPLWLVVPIIACLVLYIYVKLYLSKEDVAKQYFLVKDCINRANAIEARLQNALEEEFPGRELKELEEKLDDLITKKTEEGLKSLTAFRSDDKTEKKATKELKKLLDKNKSNWKEEAGASLKDRASQLAPREENKPLTESTPPDNSALLNREQERGVKILRVHSNPMNAVLLPVVN